MKNTLLTMGVFAGLVASANAFSIDLKTLTGNFGTQVFTQDGCTISISAGGSANGTTNVATSPFGIVLDPGESIVITITGCPVTNFQSTVNTVGASGSQTGSGNVFTIANAAAGGSQTATFVTQISGDVVPEPSSAALIALASVGFLARRRK